MKAVQLHEHGDVDRLVYEEIPNPVPDDGEILLRVRACGVNYLDIDLRRGRPGMQLQLPLVLGSDIAGEVVTLGPGVDSLRAGERVLLAPAVTCGSCQYCLAGADNLCNSFSAFGVRRSGGYAEYVLAPASNAISLPSGLRFEEAAALPVAFSTAWHMLITQARLSVGETVLVIAAGSGIGSAAVQIAKLYHCNVIATASSDEKLDKARNLGADETINHSHENISDQVMRFTKKAGVDVVFEHVGSATWSNSLRSLGRNARLVTCGALTGSNVNLNLRQIINHQITISGSFFGSKAELMRMMPFFARRQLIAVVDKVFPLTEVAESHRRVEAREHFGKVVLAI